MVPKVRVSLWGLPSGPGVRQQTTNDFLCTSIPAQWVYSRSIWHLHSIHRLAGYPGVETLLCVLPRLNGVRQCGVPTGSRVRRPSRLLAPVTCRPRCQPRRYTTIFSSCVVRNTHGGSLDFGDADSIFPTMRVAEVV